MNIASVEKAAKEELDREEFRIAVEKCKAKLREKRAQSWLTKVFPWKIVIVRR